MPYTESGLSVACQFIYIGDNMNRAIFFDRDGVLNEEVGYLYEIEKFKWTAGAIQAIKFCNDKNILAIVVTNQSGIARGFYTSDDVKNLHDYMQAELKKFDAHIDAFYFCPHYPDNVCDCRKPKPGMILQAAKDFDIDLKESYLIGDSQRDIESGKNAGLRGEILFLSGNLFEVIKNLWEK